VQNVLVTSNEITRQRIEKRHRIMQEIPDLCHVFGTRTSPRTICPHGLNVANVASIQQHCIWPCKPPWLWRA
jgi:hypothetical protein